MIGCAKKPSDWVCQKVFSEIFKKTPKVIMKRSLEIRKVRILEYSSTHAAEVWVKYTMNDEEDWRKLSILKRSAVPSLPVATESRKYSRYVHVKPTEAADLKTLAAKYVPDVLHAFYTSRHCFILMMSLQILTRALTE